MEAGTKEIKTYHSCSGSLEWLDCYKTMFPRKALYVKEAIAHPAKMSPALCFKIIEHLRALELLEKDDVICDFMSGIGTTNIIASLYGYKSISVELEPKFVEWEKANKQKLEKETLLNVNWEIIQGDARQLSTLIKNDTVGVISPPYSTSQDRASKGKIQEGSVSDFMHRAYDKSLSGASDDNIGNLPDKVGIVSPPYEDAINAPANSEKRKERLIKAGYNPDEYQGGTGRNLEAEIKYGDTPGQIGKLRGIISPPYANRLDKGNEKQKMREGTLQNKMNYGGYTTDENNIGNLGNSDNKETYLDAMATVYSEAYKAGISPLVVVTKNPTRNKQLRRLDLDTIYLLEKVGYKIIDYHRAILWEYDKDGVPRGRLSFFKRLQVNRGLPAAMWEDVIFAE